MRKSHLANKVSKILQRDKTMSSGRTLCWKMKTHHVAWDKWRDIVQRTRGEKKCLPPFSLFECGCVLRHKTHHALWIPGKHSLAWVWQRRCYQLRRLTHFTLSPRALQSQNHATAAASSAWQEDIFTTRGMSFMEHHCTHWANMLVHTRIHVHKVIMPSVHTCAWSG